ncbi:Peptidoglycan/xylan/chitin deacetylase, PgdA/CDA1 family [Thermomonospora echinospora]|uniref:Peptidoglycan/xylan/chitin deacetylase, PgdA/CDA1 family n=1 Tax=Thermomonospora echinospora TaxID=1992 RepID=A0A1H6CB69_9ACTN|nr:polysaccharide deacetylase family protein [Thermomonospora echinospora]SEG70221.1 Peptidoglycan/xylan/chitin deacetylase, PgdA/CDA1 family [Thermomonospora echinospora]
MEFSAPTRRRLLWTLGAVGFAVATASDSVRGVTGAAANSSGPAARPTPSRTPGLVPSASPSLPVQTPPVPGQPPGLGSAALLPGRPGWKPTRVRRRKDAVTNLKELGPDPDRPPRALALTIDDGPHPQYTPQILDLLAEHQVTATFFVVGEMVREYPLLTRRIVEAGHQICNHTMTHPSPFNLIGARRIHREIAEAHARVAQVTGVVPKFFRAPGGAWSRQVMEETAEYGMIPIGWEVDPSDWRRPGVGRIKRALLDSEEGAIMLCHDGGGDRSQTVAALRQVLPRLKKRGMTFVPL